MTIYIAVIITDLVQVDGLLTRRAYIGKTIDELEDRIKEHFRLSKVQKGSRYWKHKYYFHHAIRKHGEQNVIFEVLQDGITDETQLRRKQVMYIRLFKTFGMGYNQTKGRQGISGYKHKLETLRHLSQVNKGRRNHFYNKRHTDETKKIMKQNHRNFKGQNGPMYGKKHTEQSKKKMRQNHADFRGRKGTFYGKHHSNQIKKYFHDLYVGKKIGPQSEQHKQKRRRALIGKPQTQQRKNNIRMRLKKHWQKVKARKLKDKLAVA